MPIARITYCRAGFVYNRIMKSLRDIIHSAEKKRIAIGHFNIAELEMLKGISHAVAKLNLPVFIGTSEGERKYLGVHHSVDLIASYNKEHAKEGGYHMFLNADHTHSLDKVKEAAEVGYDAILFDGGKLPFEENIAQTKEAVEIVKGINPDILVEGELGYIGSSSKLLDEVPEGAQIKEEDLTTPEQAEEFAKKTGIDLLAPAVGNLHGMFKNAPNPKLNIERIREVRKAAGVPLVLHGGSGVSDEDFRAAIEAGVAIIHISTELRVAWRAKVESALAEKSDEIAPYKLLPGAIDEIERIVYNRLKLFNNL